jgi:hypothetical protein
MDGRVSFLNSNMRAAVVLLSIMIPVSLFTGLRLTGVLPDEPVISQTTKLLPVTWETERSAASNPYLAQEYVNASYKGDIELTSTVSILYPGYDVYFGTYEGALVGVNATATLQKGFIYEVNVTFWENYSDSTVGFQTGQIAQNLSILFLSDYFTGQRGNGLKAFVTLAGKNQPNSVHFDTNDLSWRLNSPFNQTHIMEVDVEITYYNGTNYESIIQPFLLTISSDNNTTFQSATPVSDGIYTNLYAGYEDPLNYYKIYLETGRTIKISFNETSDFWFLFRVYIYDSEQTLRAETAKPDLSQTIEFTSDSTGYWSVLVKAENEQARSGFFYTMEVTG